MNLQEPQESERKEALDPATPAARLMVLMEEHLDEVLQNPALPLVLLEQPGFWTDMGDALRHDVAASPRCPPDLVTWALRDEDRTGLLAVLMQNRALDPALRRRALLQRSGAEPADFTGPVEAPVIDERALRAELLTPDEAALLARAERRDATLTEPELLQLAALGERGRRLAVDLPNCPVALLTEVLHGGTALRWAAMKHPRLDPVLLQALLRSAHIGERLHAVLNPSVSPAQFAEAAADEDFYLQGALASSPAMPAAWAEHFLQSPQAYIRQKLASNPTVPPDAQLALAEDRNGNVRRELLQNPNVTAEAKKRAQRYGR